MSSEQEPGLSLSSLLPPQETGRVRPAIAGGETQEVQIGRIGLRLTFRQEMSELQVRGEEGVSDYSELFR